MTEPRTEAGRRMLGNWQLETSPDALRDILAIEAEAVAPSDAGLREALDTIDRLILGEQNVARETGRPIDAGIRISGMAAARDAVAALARQGTESS